MSIYPSPKLRDGVLNTVFNSADYIKDLAGSGLSLTQTDALYLKNSGVVVSSANTTFNGTVDIGALCTVNDLTATGTISGNVSGANITSSTLGSFKDLTATGTISGNVSGANITSSTLGSFKDLTTTGLLTAGNVSATNINVSNLGTYKDLTTTGVLTTGNVSATNINVTALTTVKDLTIKGLLKSTQTSDTLTADFWRNDQVYSYTNGMVYSLISDDAVVNSVSFINIPTTINQSYIFTFIIQPSVANNPFYIKSNTNTIKVNDVSIPLYGLQNVSLPAKYTYLVQQISIIYNLYATDPKFIALTSISAY